MPKKTFLIKNSLTESKIILGEKLKNINKYLPQKKIIIITDTIVNKLYNNNFKNFDVIEIGVGEKIKSLKTITVIIKKLLKLNADRNTFLLGVGGGVVCDITGFVASIFMRGIKFGFVATTLLAQVDASIGGKNGVNFSGYKNTIGTFNQPQFVICDINFLKTLPKKEIYCGLGEIIKHSIISGDNFFNYIIKNINKIKQNNLQVFYELINLSIKLKTDIVNNDETENNKRKILNLGHTIAHAIEKQTNLSHGQAVVAGIKFTVDFSLKKQFISKQQNIKIKNLINSLDLTNAVSVDKKLLISSIKKDKKKNIDNLEFIFVKSIGNVFAETISIKELNYFIKNYNF